MPNLDDLTASPEARIFERVLVEIRADALLSGAFRPIRSIESPTRESFANYGQGSLAVQPFVVKEDGHPSQRSTSRFGIMISAFVRNEESEEDSILLGLNLGSHIRAIVWGLAVTDGSGNPLSFATTDFRQLTPLLSVDGSTRILSYLATFETDIDPRLNDFTA